MDNIVKTVEKFLTFSEEKLEELSQKNQELREKNIERSYSRKGNPWDNAIIESFHSIIKREWLNRYRIEDVRQARRLIFEYIETFYNSRRIHSHCNMLSPNKYEKRYG